MAQWRILPTIEIIILLTYFLFCTVLYCTVLYCTVLYYALLVLYCGINRIILLMGNDSCSPVSNCHTTILNEIRAVNYIPHLTSPHLGSPGVTWGHLSNNMTRYTADWLIIVPGPALSDWAERLWPINYRLWLCKWLGNMWIYIFYDYDKLSFI